MARIDGRIVWFLLISSVTITNGAYDDEGLGCYRSGSELNARVPDCGVFNIPINGCAGYCRSSSIATSPEELAWDPNQTITSNFECCTIVETEEWPADVRCYNETVIRIKVPTAKSCACSQCQKLTSG